MCPDLLAALERRIGALHDGIISRGKLDTRDAIEIGRLLQRVKELNAGTFTRWVEERCRFSYMQATRYMRLARAAVTHNKLLDLPLCDAYAAAGIIQYRNTEPAELEDTRTAGWHPRKRVAPHPPSISPGHARRIGSVKRCECSAKHIGCAEPGEWAQAQLAVWRFRYESRDVRDKMLHPATFPIALASKVISLFSHPGELVVDPFCGAGTTLMAARDLGRNALGFDLVGKFVSITRQRLEDAGAIAGASQLAICSDAREAPRFIRPGTVKLVFTSPPYANLLDRVRRNVARRTPARFNYQYGKNERYSADKRDVGNLEPSEFGAALTEIFSLLLPALRDDGNCVLNVADLYRNDRRIPLHVLVIAALESAGLELRNTIIWDKTNVVNRIGIFGYPSNYIAMSGTFEYLLHFRKRRM